MINNGSGSAAGCCHSAGIKIILSHSNAYIQIKMRMDRMVAPALARTEADFVPPSPGPKPTADIKSLGLAAKRRSAAGLGIGMEDRHWIGLRIFHARYHSIY